MKLAICLIIVTAIYVFAMTKLIKELKAHSSAEERKQNQSYPMMFAATVLFIAIVTSVIRLTVQGVLPLI